VYLFLTSFGQASVFRLLFLTKLLVHGFLKYRPLIQLSFVCFLPYDFDTPPLPISLICFFNSFSSHFSVSWFCASWVFPTTWRKTCPLLVLLFLVFRFASLSPRYVFQHIFILVGPCSSSVFLNFFLSSVNLTPLACPLVLWSPIRQ